jgi:CspA family cold shock protein
MSEGSIKRETDRGFGFVQTNRGNDLLLHLSAVEGSAVEPPREGRRVSFVDSRDGKESHTETVRAL